MSKDNVYAPIEFLYRSRGLSARSVQDEAPKDSYLQYMNMLERAENSTSSRYGTQIINRDAAGVGTSNYPFPSNVNSLAKLSFQGIPYRYAGTVDGRLYRRASNGQGAYSLLGPGGEYTTAILSGQPWQSVVANCYQSSQPYLFIYDADVSIKDNGTFSNPQLTGIDPPLHVANTQPYSPLLTLIDNFASGNTYAASGFSGSWSYSSLGTVTGSIGQTVVDFTEYVNANSATETIAGGSAATAQTGGGTSASNNTFSGFASSAVTGPVTISVSVSAIASVAPPVVSGSVSYNSNAGLSVQYSINGSSFITFYSYSFSSSGSLPSTPISATVSGLTNINTLYVRVAVSAFVYAGGTSTSITATLGTITASAGSSGAFSDISNGMISVLNSNESINVPIVSIVSSGLSSGQYTTLSVSTGAAHGLTGSANIAIYGSSNDQADGFYTATVTGAESLTVPYVSSASINATGGVLVGGSAAPAECVLTNLYTSPYPTQFSAWGFYQQVPASIASFPIGYFSGNVPQNSTATVGNTIALNLDINNQATDDDLIVITLQVGDPAAISNIRLQFDVNGSDYTSSYYYKDIAPAYYQQGVEGLQDAYTTTEQQIFADTLGLLTGSTSTNPTINQLQPSNFATGPDAWIACYLRRGDFTPVGTANQPGLDWSNITGWQLVIDTNTVGNSTVSVNGLYFQWGYGPSSFGGVGYDYRYTYFNQATGTESNGSQIMAFGGQQFGYLSSQSAPIYLRQAVQVTGNYSPDTQNTHVRMYRRGGNLTQNGWLQIGQFPNVPTLVEFAYKDVVPDLALTQAQILVLDNDPPVTSSLVNPISTTLLLPSTGPGSTFYSTFSSQYIPVASSSAFFKTGQIALVGNAANLEEVRIEASGDGFIQATLRLQHNAGEPVVCESTPRTACNLCALAYNQVWLAGDPNNPHYLYHSKKNQPESFGPEDYIPVGSPQYPIVVLAFWRNTLFVATTQTWWTIPGSQYAPQPTGSIHGAVASQGWTITERGIVYRSSDGYRLFSGADGIYMTLMVEQIFRPLQTSSISVVPLADLTQQSQDVCAYYNNSWFASYISTTNSGQRFRLVFDQNYERYRQDDVAATAMLWEQDTNALIVAKNVAGVGPCVVQDQIGDYDDGGWSSGQLAQTPINLTVQTPYQDLGKPHFPKQWNVLETDCNTQGQTLDTQLLFDSGEPASLTLAAINTGTTRQKQQLQINAGLGEQSYSMSLVHTISATTAPTLYQENIYATLLADYRSSYDTYDIKFSIDEEKIAKEGYFDYTSSSAITVNLYADESIYYSFALPATAARAVVRARFPCFPFRIWRLTMTCAAAFQLWASPQIRWKAIRGSASDYQPYELQL